MIKRRYHRNSERISSQMLGFAAPEKVKHIIPDAQMVIYVIYVYTP